MAGASGTHTMAAADGRTLTIAEWGDPDGFPVFCDDLVPVGAARTSFSTANWTKQLAQDGARVRAAATIVRADLSLPPARASSF